VDYYSSGLSSEGRIQYILCICTFCDETTRTQFTGSVCTRAAHAFAGQPLRRRHAGTARQPVRRTRHHHAAILYYIKSAWKKGRPLHCPEPSAEHHQLQELARDRAQIEGAQGRRRRRSRGGKTTRSRRRAARPSCWARARTRSRRPSGTATCSP